jgi:hypothetical protein
MADEPISASGTPAVFEINDGVRRSKAAQLAGIQRIPANVGSSSAVLQVSLDQVRSSPLKPVLDITAPREEARWKGVLQGIVGGNRIRPIHVRKMVASRGLPMRDVLVVKNGRPVDPFTGA